MGSIAAKPSVPVLTNTDPSPAALARFARLTALYSRDLIVSGRVCEDRTPAVRLWRRVGGDPGRPGHWRPMPDGLAVRVFVCGRELTLAAGEVLGFWQRLTLADGVYESELTLRDACGRSTRVQTMRFVPLHRPAVVMQRYVVAPLDHQGGVEIFAGIRACGPCGPVRFDAEQTGRARMRIRACGDEGPAPLVALARPHRRTRLAELRCRIEHDGAWGVFDCPGGQRSVIEQVAWVGKDAAADDEGQMEDFYRVLERSRRLWRSRWQRLDERARARCAADADAARAAAALLAALPDTETVACGRNPR